MVLGGDVATAQNHAVKRVRRTQVQAFDHYSSGGGTWVSRHVCTHVWHACTCIACLYVRLLVCVCMHVCMHMCANVHVGMHAFALGQALVAVILVHY